MMVFRVSNSGAISGRPVPLSCPQRAKRSFRRTCLRQQVNSNAGRDEEMMPLDEVQI